MLDVNYFANSIPQSVADTLKSLEVEGVTSPTSSYIDFIEKTRNIVVHRPNYLNTIPSVPDYFQEFAWRDSSTPQWSSVLKRLKNFESKYNLSSSEMYSKYRSGSLGPDISKVELNRWIDDYILFAL